MAISGRRGGEVPALKEADMVVESVMTFALGFLAACLIALALAAPLWRRAERVTRKRLESTAPVSTADFAAEKDKLRADFALSTRKLELSLDRLRKKAQEQMTSVQERNTKLNTLEAELKEKTASETGNTAKLNELTEKLARAESDLKTRVGQLDDMKSKLSELQSVMNRQSNAIKEAASLSEGQKDEISTLQSDVETRDSEIARQASAIGERDARLAECGERVAAEKVRLGQTMTALKEKEKLVASLQAEAEKREAAYGKTVETLKARVASLEVTESELQEVTVENRTLKAQLSRVSEDFSKRVADDNRENAHLRQRIGDLAADVQRMTEALDSDGTDFLKVASAIAPRTARGGGAPRNEGAKSALSKSLAPALARDDDTPSPELAARGDLADRIRSLQRGILG
jgi:chromosome segregation ATPase